MKTLIIKGEGSSFERYFNHQMKRKNIDIESVRTPQNKIDIILYYIVKEFDLVPLFAFWLKGWKKKIKDYDNIIIFDNGLTPILLKWIRKKNKKARIKIWLWNIDNNYDMNFYKKYGEVYCFDKSFANLNKIHYINQFYIPKTYKSKSTPTNGILYVGADKMRYTFLKRLAQQLKKEKIPYYFYLQKWQGKRYQEKENDIELSSNLMSYEDVIKNIYGYNCILELNIKGQEGFTLRTLEALFYKKKLITNNKNIKNFSFYNKNDFYILGNEDRSLKEFMNTDYEKIDNTFLKKYTYDYWLKTILS